MQAYPPAAELLPPERQTPPARAAWGALGHADDDDDDARARRGARGGAPAAATTRTLPYGAVQRAQLEASLAAWLFELGVLAELGDAGYARARARRRCRG